MTPIDSFLDRLSAARWSYGITTYVDEDGQHWTQIDARRGDEVKVRRWRANSVKESAVPR